MRYPPITPQMLMPIIKLSLIKANQKRFMRHPELRIEKAQYLEDLLNHMSYGVRCHIGKLSMKVENGCIVEHRYTQGKKER